MAVRKKTELDFMKVMAATGGGFGATIALEALEKFAPEALENEYIGPLMVEGLGLAVLTMGGPKLEPFAYGMLGAAGADIGAMVLDKMLPGNPVQGFYEDGELDGWLKNKLSRIKKQVAEKKLSPKQVVKAIADVNKKGGRAILKSHNPKEWKGLAKEAIANHKGAFSAVDKLNRGLVGRGVKDNKAAFKALDRFNRGGLKRAGAIHRKMTPKYVQRANKKAMSIMGLDCDCD